MSANQMKRAWMAVVQGADLRWITRMCLSAPVFKVSLILAPSKTACKI
jgi:hypothetical protein